MRSLRIVALVFSFATIFAAADVFAALSDGLVAYYPFNENANDESGNAHHGSENGGLTYSSGVVGMSASFDGVDDFVTVSVALTGSADWTISGWVNIAEINPSYTDWQNIVSNTAEGFAVGLRTSDASLEIWDSGVVLNAGPNTISTNVGTFVAFRKAGNSLEIFQNGASVGQNVSGSSVSFTQLSVIGMWAETSSNSFDQEPLNGLLDELRIYDRALSNAEIDQLAAVPEPASLVLVPAGLIGILASLRLRARLACSEIKR